MQKVQERQRQVELTYGRYHDEVQRKATKECQKEQHLDQQICSFQQTPSINLLHRRMQTAHQRDAAQ